MNLFIPVAFTLIVLGFGQLAIMLMIALRYIMDDGRVFRYLTLIPIAVMSLACFSMAFLAVTGVSDVFGLSGLVLLLVYFFCAGVVWWVFAVYTLKVRWGQDRVENVNTINGQLENMAREDEDRFSEAEFEKTEVRSRLTDAALVAKADLDASSARIEAKLDRIIALVEGGADD